jgi:hypothetical protein
MDIHGARPALFSSVAPRICWWLTGLRFSGEYLGSFLTRKEDWRRREEYFLGADLEDAKNLRLDQREGGSIGSTLKSGRKPGGGEREKERPTVIQRFGLARYDSSGYETDIERGTAEILWFGMTCCR